MSMKKQTASTYEKAAHETLRCAYEIGERRIAEAVAAEREAVAEMADRSVEKWKQLMAEGGITDMSLATIRARIREAQTLATAIRARGIIADGEVGEAHA